MPGNIFPLMGGNVRVFEHKVPNTFVIYHNVVSFYIAPDFKSGGADVENRRADRYAVGRILHVLLRTFGTHDLSFLSPELNSGAI